jgi:Zn-finger nucleic acid-binding protein
MDAPSFDRLYGRRLTLDVCRRCQAVWFDDQELLQLTPGATLQLLTALAEDRGATREPWTAEPKCPRCSRVLVETHDL